MCVCVCVCVCVWVSVCLGYYNTNMRLIDCFYGISTFWLFFADVNFIYLESNYMPAQLAGAVEYIDYISAVSLI